MRSRTSTGMFWVSIGLVLGVQLASSTAFAAVIAGATGATADAAVAKGISTIWTYLLFIVPLLGVAAILFGLWNAITTDRGQTSSVVGGLTTVGVGLVMVFIPAIIIASFGTSGSQAASLSEVASVFVEPYLIDWQSPITLLIVLGIPIGRLMALAEQRGGTLLQVPEAG